MNRFLWYSVICLAIALTGCDTAEQPKQTAPHQVVKPQEQKRIKEEGKTPIEKAQAVVEMAEEKTAHTAKVAKDVTLESLPPVEEDAEDVKKTINGVSQPPVVTPKDNSAEQAVRNEPNYPGEIVLSASYGNITFTHGQHAKDLECSTCHEGTPAAFDISKDVAHKLCKGCHKDGGAGPVGCKDCHKK